MNNTQLQQVPANKVFSQFDESVARQFAEQFGTPLFIIDEAGVLARLQALQGATQKRYANSLVSVSYKTNFVPGLLSLLHAEGAHAEVVSGIEYEVARNLKMPEQKIIFNGPMKLDCELVQAIEDGAIINCDHEDEIDRIEKIAKQLQTKVGIGMRVHFPNAGMPWNRFGFPVTNGLKDAQTLALVKRIIESPNLTLSGLHSHIGTNIRDLSYFAKLGQLFNDFAFELKNEFGIELSWIDVGGGLAGIAPYIEEATGENSIVEFPLPDADAYADAVITPLLPYLTSMAKPALLIFEPGRTLFEAFGALLTSVVGRRPEANDDSAAVICDAGINTLATSYVYDFPVKAFAPVESIRQTKLFGPTCNQKDQLHSPLPLPALKSGDLLLFSGVGSYCMAFSYSFIRFRPGVALWRGGTNGEWLRKPETIKHNAELELIPERRKQYA